MRAPDFAPRLVEDQSPAVTAVGPHYASGCFVMFEASVDIAELGAMEDDEGALVWSSGPIAVVRRRTDLRDEREIPRQERAEKLGPELSRLLLGEGRRFHRYLRHTLYSTQKERADRALVITGAELVLADPSIGATAEGNAAGASAQNEIPAVVIVHLDPAQDDSALSGWSTLTRDGLDNRLRPILINRQSLCADVEAILAGTQHPAASMASVDFTESAARAGAFEDGASHRPAAVRLLGADGADSRALVSAYSVLADVSESLSSARLRLASEPLTPGLRTRLGASEGNAGTCTSQTLRMSRSRGLAELSSEQWCDGLRTDRPAADPAPSAVSWSNWHATFSPYGAGFAYVPKGNKASPFRRDHLSTFVADLLALEVLRGRMLKGFSDSARRIARELVRGETDHEVALDLWKRFAAFTTDYDGGVTELSPGSAEVVGSFRAGLSRDVAQALQRTQDNLDRLAGIVRMEQDEMRRKRDLEGSRIREMEARSEQRDTARRSHDREAAADRERSFNFFISLFATSLLPLTVIPPILEWFYVNPDHSTALPRALWTVGLTITFIAVFQLCLAISRGRRQRRDKERRSKSEEWRL